MQTSISESLDTPLFNQEVLPNSLQAVRQTSYAGIVSQCSTMRRIFSMIDRVSRTDTTVLILGETGTGKELVARAIHRMSGREGNMVPVNCGAIPEDILESELFGHERGAFTGAVNSRVGRFQLADKGTIFLDEIGEMSPKLQVKLLRVLQERTVEPVGSTRSIPIDVRVVAATNKDLQEEVKAGRFREDLFYRLQVIPMTLPPLRERGSDVDILTDYFLEKSCTQIGRPNLVMSTEAKAAFHSYEWPGNVRELENVIERLSVLADGDEIHATDLPVHIIRQGEPTQFYETLRELPEEGVDFNELLNDYGNRLIELALVRTNGNKKAAAELLNLKRTTLVEKIKKQERDCSREFLPTGSSLGIDPLFPIEG